MSDAALPDARLHAPAVARNRDAIREVLAEILRETVPAGGRVLEVASGSGEHAARCAGPLGVALWQPSDPDPAARQSIAAWAATQKDAPIAPPLDLDVQGPDWPVPTAPPFDVILSINMVHIAPWAAAEGLFAGAARHLAPEGRLVLYGPFKRHGAHHAPSNAAFDESLRARDPAWGVRDIDDLDTLAGRHDMVLTRMIPMPANNHTLVFAGRSVADQTTDGKERGNLS